jgi:hypothetical protein
MKAKQMMMGVVAAVAMGAMAETANTVKVTKFHQSYPYSGKATVEYTVGGTLPANAVAEITINTDDASATFTQRNIVAGANSHVIDFASSFGGALVLTNASFVVTIGLGGVQLWENGPYWAECNVGATKPEEYGYYFWWGDTVGYKREGNAWVATDGSSSNFQFYDDPISQQTYNKSIATLQSEGWIVSKDGTYVLAPEHDAAHVHWGGEWRMPTLQELADLNSKCDWTWTTMNGVQGYLVKGKGGYTSASIFLPCAGNGYGPSLDLAGSDGNYWSSVPYSGYNSDSWYLFFTSGSRSTCYDGHRYYGQSVRPVQGFTE